MNQTEMNFRYIIYQVEDGVAKITLNRPPLNIMNTEMLIEITRALESANKEEKVWLIVLKGEGRFFSAGADIADHMPDKVDDFIKAFSQIFYTAIEIDKPIIAAVNGDALGGGCELVLSADLVIMSEQARLGQPEITVGVFAPVAIATMPFLTSKLKAAELNLTGNLIKAEEALHLGLCNQVVPSDKLDETVNSVISNLRGKSPIVLRITKRALKKGFDRERWQRNLEHINRIYMKELMKTNDAVEGLRAFLEKRKPTWQGK